MKWLVVSVISFISVVSISCVGHTAAGTQGATTSAAPLTNKITFVRGTRAAGQLYVCAYSDWDVRTEELKCIDWESFAISMQYHAPPQSSK